MERKGDDWIFKVRARPFTGWPILFQQILPNHQLNKSNLEKINESFKNNLRYLAHTGGWPDKEHEDPKAMLNELQKWSSTDTGLAIKPYDDPIRAFTPFTL